jgi:hypothetical protein
LGKLRISVVFDVEFDSKYEQTSSTEQLVSAFMEHVFDMLYIGCDHDDPVHILNAEPHLYPIIAAKKLDS